jgi:hypothetical protein
MFDKTLTTKDWTKRIPSTPQHTLDDLVCFGRINSSYNDTRRVTHAMRYHKNVDIWYTAGRVSGLIWFDSWCLTPLSAIFQLYYGDQF